jgi:hypothetical protein
MAFYTPTITKLKESHILLTILCVLFIIWSVVFFYLHPLNDTNTNQGKYVKLSPTQIEVLIALNDSAIYTTDTALISPSVYNDLELPAGDTNIILLLSQTQRINALNGYLKSIGIVDSVHMHNDKQFFVAINKRLFLAESYFWLKGNWLILEVLLFALLGVLCNSLYHISENLRTSNYNTKEAVVYYVKLFYAPAVTLIIYLGIDLLISDSSSVATVSNTVVLSFILGFFSGRSIEILQRFKNFLVPPLGKPPPVKKEAPVKTAEYKAFIGLPVDEQKKIINEFIKTNATNLKTKYPEIQGLSARRKNRGGLELEQYALLINVKTKSTNIPAARAIPKTLPYVLDAMKYDIPTDIEGVGKNSLSIYSGENVSPKQLGLSCSREEPKSPSGTIGLKVNKNGVPHLLSCYHVLCPHELQQRQLTFPSGKKAVILSPGLIDGNSRTEIAEVTEGYLDDLIDAAIAKLKDDTILQNIYYKENWIPNGTLPLTPDHTRRKINVKLVGRTSGRREGFLVDHFQQVVFLDDYPAGTKDRLHHLIITTKISDKGDSGATVIDSDNKVIGLLVGDNDTYSFVIPINTIFSRMDLQL